MSMSTGQEEVLSFSIRQVFKAFRRVDNMAARPTVTVWSATGESSGSLPLPTVFTAPIRLDVVQQVHSGYLLLFWSSGVAGDGTGRISAVSGMEHGEMRITRYRNQGGRGISSTFD